MLTSKEVLNFWLDEIGPKGWYAGGDDLDQRIRAFAEKTWEKAMDGSCAFWLTHPSGVLAYSILMDQLPRNMFRGSGKAFSSDIHARAAVKAAIERKWDQRIDAPARQFFFLPLMHSESLTDQERSIRMFMTHMPDTSLNGLLHARAHREVIRRFGRFPGRNEALGRKMSADEAVFQQNGGYSLIVKDIEAGRCGSVKIAQVA